MKLHQIPVVHNIVTRWRHNAGKSMSDPELDHPANSKENRSIPVHAPPSPKSPSKKSVRITEADSLPRRESSGKGKGKGKGRETAVPAGPAASAPMLPSPPPSPPAPRISLRSRPANRCSSGSPASHSELGEVTKRFGVVHVHETFECENAVDPVRLLTLSRRTLLNEARARGGNTLVDEVWEYTVSKRGKTYIVKIDYTAGAVLIEGATDPQKPVAIDIAKTKGVNGLMTVTSRH